MSIRFGFFNSINGDRKYNAEDMTKYFDKLVSDGVYHDSESALKVTPVDLSDGNLSIQIQAGRGLIKCHWLENDSPYNIILDESHVTLDRIDYIVMRLNLNESARNMELAVIKGTSFDPASAQIKPTLSGDPLITELILAEVFVGHGVTAITELNITDHRNDPAYCGWVRSLIGSGGSSGILRKYQTHQVLESETSVISPNISQYNSDSILMVFVGGIMLIENVEYTVSGFGLLTQINLVNSIRPGNPITCIVMRVE